MRALSQAEAAAIDTSHVVHGVDAAGAYLGLVPAEQATAVAASAPPSEGTWRWQGGAWQRVLTLDEAKTLAMGRMKAAREAALQGNFNVGGLVFQINPVNITGATVRAMRAQAAAVPYAQTWLLADNSTTVLDAAQMITVGEACAAAVDAIWQISIGLRAQIDAASDVAQVDGIAWPG